MSAYFKLNQDIQDRKTTVIGPSSAFVHELDDYVPKSIEVSHQIVKKMKGSHVIEGGTYLTLTFLGYQSEEKRNHYYSKLFNWASQHDRQVVLPLIEFYTISNSFTTNEENIKTELQIKIL